MAKKYGVSHVAHSGNAAVKTREVAVLRHGGNRAPLPREFRRGRGSMAARQVPGAMAKGPWKGGLSRGHASAGGVVFIFPYNAGWCFT